MEATVTTLAPSGTARGRRNHRLVAAPRRLQPPARPPPPEGRQPGRLLAGARALPAVLPPLLPDVANRTRARPRERPRDLRGQPPLVPGPVRDRNGRPPAHVLRGQGGAVPPPHRGLVLELAGRLPRAPRPG